MIHPVRQFITNYCSLPDKDWGAIESHLNRHVLPKSTILLEEGKICRHLYFLESGLLRFYIWKDGYDITKYFTEAPYCFTSQRSFTTQRVASESIETLEDSIIWEMPHQQAYDLLQLKSWNNFIRELIQEVQYYTEQILEEMQNETAENRYRKMLTQQPHLVQRIPLKHLASYLGIAPQSISRIRKKIMTEKGN